MAVTSSWRARPDHRRRTAACQNGSGPGSVLICLARGSATRSKPRNPLMLWLTEPQSAVPVAKLAHYPGPPGSPHPVRPLTGEPFRKTCSRIENGGLKRGPFAGDRPFAVGPAQKRLRPPSQRSPAGAPCAQTPRQQPRDGPKTSKDTKTRRLTPGFLRKYASRSECERRPILPHQRSVNKPAAR